MANKNNQIEVRLARLEKEVELIKTKMVRSDQGPWWHQIVGDIGDKKVFAEIVRLGRLIRQGKIKG